ncbi:MAG TPA: FtsX-like permease family protein [Hyphomicrobiales bacterium]|nr:FtsX-like permease family protein [Hyphomicrobiales bacterium]
MLGSAFKISLRTLYREKRYAAINIAGLALALACVLILGLYLRSELTYDRHYEGYENIYRLENEFLTNGVTASFAVTSAMVGPLLSQDIPDIEEFVRFRPNNEMMLTHDDLGYFWERTFFASPNVFRVFKQPILFGDPDTALDDPSSVAVSETFARTYFGNANPIGEVLKTDSGTEYRVSLVFADPPENTHFTYDVLFSENNPAVGYPTNIVQQRRSLYGVGLFNYLKMRPGYDPADWAASSQAFFDKNMKEFGDANSMSWSSWLQPLADVHLHSTVGYDEPRGNLYYLYAFAAVAVFILAVACINYMNLATARSAKRAREVGMRKILGSSRKALIVQFLSESILYSVIALVCALVLVELVFYFTNINDLLNKPLALQLTREPQLVGIAALFSLGIGVLAGLYPALYLSSWQPLTALVGNKNSSRTSATFRSALVFVQFTISVAVIACTLLMAQQMRYVAGKDLGFEKENKLVVPLHGFSAIQQTELMKSALMKNPNVLGVATSGSMLGGRLGSNAIPMETMGGVMEPNQASNIVVGPDFADVMKLELVAGRSFSQRLLTDVGTNFIVNESLVQRMGWGDQALGKKIADGRVIGVVKDFHYASLHQSIEPFLMRTFPDDYLNNVPEANKAFMTMNLVVSISGENVRDTIAFIEDTVTGFDPRHPFEFSFFDATLDQLYQSEENLMRLVGIFAAVCIFISCLGLYGLAAFTTEQRTREIGVRKVLGATALQIIALLSRSVLWLVLAGAVVACALSWLAIDQWLTGFAYRAGINPLAFVIASLAALLIAYGTIALQSYKTAQADPSGSLRFE